MLVVVIGSDPVFWTLAAVLFVLSLVGLLLTFLFWSATLSRARIRGYPPGIVGLVITAVAAVAAGAPLWLASRLPGWDGPSPSSDLTPVLVVDACFSLPALALTVCWLVVRTLRSRPRGQPGLRPRRHHYRIWSYISGAATAPLAAAMWWYDGVSNAYRVTIVGMGITAGLRRLERRFSSQVPEDDVGEAYLLYLRAFAHEARPGFKLPSEQAEFVGNGVRRWVSLDRYLASAVEVDERLGPLVALGNPLESVPLGGAVRVYVDGDWRAALMRLAANARAIVMEPVASTASLEFEFRYLADAGLADRLFVITPHRRRGVMWPVTRFMDAVMGWTAPGWDRFADQMTELTSWPLREVDPGPEAVIGLDATGRPHVLARNVTTPGEVADLIGTEVAARSARQSAASGKPVIDPGADRPGQWLLNNGC